MSEKSTKADERKPRRARGQVTLLPAPKARKPELSTLDGVRVEMSRVYLEMKSGKRDSQDGSRLVYTLSQIAKVLEIVEIEHRMRALEQRAGMRLLPAPNR